MQNILHFEDKANPLQYKKQYMQMYGNTTSMACAITQQ